MSPDILKSKCERGYRCIIIKFYCFSAVSLLEDLKRLQQLHLRNTSAKAVCRDYRENMQSLQKLDLSHNNITQLTVIARLVRTPHRNDRRQSSESKRRWRRSFRCIYFYRPRLSITRKKEKLNSKKFTTKPDFGLGFPFERRDRPASFGI